MAESPAECKPVRRGARRGAWAPAFGAASGLEGSNTYLLEKEFGWSGIVAEPARCWHDALLRNRACHVDHECVWRTTGERLAFVEVEGGYESGISQSVDPKRVENKLGKAYDVSTVSLRDLLRRYDAPRLIDYLSLDTEGSELEILKAFDFREYDVRFLTCEHNGGPNRDPTRAWLAENGFRLVPNSWDFEDWFERID